MNLEEARKQAQSELDGTADPSTDFLASIILDLADEVEQLQEENKQLQEFVDHVNRELPKLNSRFEEWLT